uniref:YY1-associated factor 2-like isoform X1 n=1 Tax=Myxine glutinosa TaxID=7769 RepID=UPI00358E316B
MESIRALGCDIYLLRTREGSDPYMKMELQAALRGFCIRRNNQRPKRSTKPQHTEDGFWDCSVCTYRNKAEAFKCSMCDVRKGTSTRKPRYSQLVAQQVVQQYSTTPPPAKKDKKEKVGERDRTEKDKDTLLHNKKNGKKVRPRLKNVDRKSAQHLEVTVGSLTVIVTDFKEKPRSVPTSASSSPPPASLSAHGSGTPCWESLGQAPAAMSEAAGDSSPSLPSTPKIDVPLMNGDAE